MNFDNKKLCFSFQAFAFHCPDLGMDGSERDLEEDVIYQNYSASEVLVQGLAGVVSQDDVGLMVRAQKEMLQRFEKTNEMLSNVNSLSGVRLDRANKDFRKHTQNVLEMKKDLETIFRRLRIIKEKLNKQCPEAYSAIIGANVQEKEEDDEYDLAIKERKVQEQLAAVAEQSEGDQNSETISKDGGNLIDL